jgi:hypothetical protein
MATQTARQWLTTQVETKIQLSEKPPAIAVWGVVLELPGDVVSILKETGQVYGYAGYFWYDYEQDGKTVCVPIKIKE